MKRARIVTDRYCGYSVQFRAWWWPFWWDAGTTFFSVEAATKYATSGAVVVDLGWVP